MGERLETVTRSVTIPALPGFSSRVRIAEPRGAPRARCG